MVGIVSYGVYVPKWRLPLDLIARGARGERSVTGPDEDSVTMAVSAAMDCLKGLDRKGVDALFFATTTSPFLEKQMATLIAKALDLREDIMTADFSNSLKGGTTALKLAGDAVKAGSARQILVVASDCRLGEPGSEHERNGGAGAAAFLMGADQAAVRIESTASVSNEIFDVWRKKDDTYINSWESRFDINDGYMKSMVEAIGAVLKKEKVSSKDISKAVFYCPDPRSPMGLAKAFGLDPKTQVQDPFFGSLGNTGTASPLLLLAAALEEAESGDTLLVASYGNGSDAMCLKVESVIKGRSGVKAQLESKCMVPDYFSYLNWRGLVPKRATRLPYSVTNASAPPLFRERNQIFSLHASKCLKCGSVEYPPQRVCAKCRAKDDYETLILTDKRCKIFTSSRDPISGQMIGLVNFEGGGRIFCNLTDGELSDFAIDTPVDMSFRKVALLPSDEIRSYVWKAVPQRNKG